MGFLVKFWGVRGSIPTPGPRTKVYGGNTSCVEIRTPNALFICDAGTGIRELGVDLINRGESPIEAHLLFSHMHWDHIQGFPFFGPAYASGNTFFVYGTDPDDTRPFDLLSGQMASDHFPVSFVDLKAKIVSSHLGGATKEVHDTRISFIPQPHPGGSYGFRFEHEGVSVVYATDIELDHVVPDAKNIPSAPQQPRKLPEQLVDFARGADLLIADAQYTDEEYQSKIGWGHPRATTATDWGIQANVKQLALFHHDPMHSDKEIDELVDTCRTRGKNQGSDMTIYAAREGLEIKIS